MGKRHKEEEHGHAGGGHGGSWLVSLCDLLSLLLCFFIVMLTMQSMDDKKFKDNFGSFFGAFGTLAKASETGMAPDFIVPIQAPIPELLVRDIKEILERRARESDDERPPPETAPEPKPYRRMFVVEATPTGVEVRIASVRMFTDETGRRLTPEAELLLREIAAEVRDSRVSARVDAFADPGQDDRDLAWKRSVTRAATVTEFLAAQPGTRRDGLSAMGYGRAAPVPVEVTDASPVRDVIRLTFSLPAFAGVNAPTGTQPRSEPISH